MSGSGTAGKRQAARAPKQDLLFDRELVDLPPQLRWREWMLRAEAVIFAATEPVSREMLARVVGRDCSIDLLIDDLREELRSRPYDIVAVGGGWQHRTRTAYAPTIRAARAPMSGAAPSLSEAEAAILAAIAYWQPITRGELSKLFGREISRDTIAGLRDAGLIASGPRSPTPGAPYSYVTTKRFLTAFGLETLGDLPDIEKLEDAGLFSRDEMTGEDGQHMSAEMEDDSSDG
jgi:segregation and condensation protein B